VRGFCAGGWLGSLWGCGLWNGGGGVLILGVIFFVSWSCFASLGTGEILFLHGFLIFCSFLLNFPVLILSVKNQA
jgi:hypothetical protein